MTSRDNIGIDRSRKTTETLISWGRNSTAQTLQSVPHNSPMDVNILETCHILTRMQSWPHFNGPSQTERFLVKEIIIGMELRVFDINTKFRETILVGVWNTSRYKVCIGFVLPYLATSHIFIPGITTNVAYDAIDHLRICDNSSSGNMRTRVSIEDDVVSMRGVKSSAARDYIANLYPQIQQYKLHHVNLGGSTLLFQVYRKGKLVTCTPTNMTLSIIEMQSRNVVPLSCDSYGMKIYGDTNTASQGTHLKVDNHGSMCLVGTASYISHCYSHLKIAIYISMSNDIVANRLVNSLRVRSF